MYYTEASKAREILKGRQDLRGTVEAWWLNNGWGLPPIPTSDDAIAMLARQLATARYEDCLFYLMASQSGLVPTWGQYIEDKHSMKSNVKKSYLQGVFVFGRGRNGGVRADRHEFLSVARPAHRKHTPRNLHESWDGRSLREIVNPATGESLVVRHNEFQRATLGISDAHRPDFSAWHRQAKHQRAADYYPRYLSLFIAHAVLFEDYHGGESGDELDRFTARIFEPAFQQISEQFGVAPIIVSLLWWPELAYYPHPDAGDWRNHGIIPAEYFHVPGR